MNLLQRILFVPIIGIFALNNEGLALKRCKIVRPKFNQKVSQHSRTDVVGSRKSPLPPLQTVSDTIKQAVNDIETLISDAKKSPVALAMAKAKITDLLFEIKGYEPNLSSKMRNKIETFQKILKNKVSNNYSGNYLDLPETAPGRQTIFFQKKKIPLCAKKNRK